MLSDCVRDAGIVHLRIAEEAAKPCQVLPSVQPTGALTPKPCPSLDWACTSLGAETKFAIK